MDKSLTVMIPSLNEESNLRPQVEALLEAARGRVSDLEILLMNDGSTDGTRAVAEDLARDDPRIRVVNHVQPRGLGFCYREGVLLATKAHYMFIAGDNQFPGDQIALLLDQLGNADVVIHNITNMRVRPLGRRVLSSGFTALLNTLLGLDVPYYNGCVIHRLDLLREVAQTTDGFAYQAEILVTLLKGGASHVTVDCTMIERRSGRSKAFQFKNVLSVVATVGRLSLRHHRKGGKR
jgi:dolichol-phosphate mannosyltransferase